jgi:hypothetical protein
MRDRDREAEQSTYRIALSKNSSQNHWILHEGHTRHAASIGSGGK